MWDSKPDWKANGILARPSFLKRCNSFIPAPPGNAINGIFLTPTHLELNSLATISKYPSFYHLAYIYKKKKKATCSQ